MAPVTRLLGLADAATGVAAVAPRRSASSSIGAMDTSDPLMLARASLRQQASKSSGRVGVAAKVLVSCRNRAITKWVISRYWESGFSRDERHGWTVTGPSLLIESASGPTQYRRCHLLHERVMIESGAVPKFDRQRDVTGMIHAPPDALDQHRFVVIAGDHEQRAGDRFVRALAVPQIFLHFGRCRPILVDQ